MAKIKRYTLTDGGYNNELGFYCPGCKCKHFISDQHTNIKAMGNGPWTFNDNFEKPTINPSILVSFTYNENIDYICHSFIKNGKIQYLFDCTHKLKGQTIEMEEING